MAKKTFKGNLGAALAATPAAAFISGTAESEAIRKAAEIPPADSSLKAEPVAVQTALSGIATEAEAAPRESKTRRLQSLLKPSLHDFLKRSAARHGGISVNDRLNAILAEAKAMEEG